MINKIIDFSVNHCLWVILMLLATLFGSVFIILQLNLDAFPDVTKAQLAIKLFGPDLDVLASKGQEIEAAIKAVEGGRDVAMEQIVGEAQLVIKPNRQQLSRFGFSVADVMDLVKNGIGGTTAGQVINGNERYDIYVRLQEKSRNNRDVIADLCLQSPTGA